MNINVTQNPFELSKAAGAAAAQLIREAIAVNGSANIIKGWLIGYKLHVVIFDNGVVQQIL